MDKKFWGKVGFVFTFVNVLDLYFTMQFMEYEMNPLVINFPEWFYTIKMISIFIVLLASWQCYE